MDGQPALTRPAWLVPTVRSVRWLPIAAASAGAFAVLAALRAVSPLAPSAPVVAVLVAVVIGTSVGAVVDPATEMLRAVPTSAGRRLARRVGVIAAPAAPAVALVGRSGAWWYGPTWSAPGLAALLALSGCGVAGVVWGERRGLTAELAAAAVIGWAVFGVVAADVGAAHSWVAPWVRWPLPVLVLSAVAAVGGVRRA